MLTIRQAHPSHYGWIAKRATLDIGTEFRAIEAVDADGRIHGMVGYDGWCPGSVAMHVAIENPAAIRRLIHTAFGLPFLEFGLPLVKGMILSDNEKSIRLVKHLGFRHVATLHEWWGPGVDINLFEMRREECRWLRRQTLRKAG
jgi:hypothetical protein